MSDLKARLAGQGVHTLLVQFTDVHGAAKGKLVKSFLTHFVSADVQKSLEALGYAALPSSVSAKITAAVAAIG